VHKLLDLLLNAYEELLGVTLAGRCVTEDLLQACLDDGFEAVKKTLLRASTFRTDAEKRIDRFVNARGSL